MKQTLPTREPDWCDQQHHPGYRVHGRVVANLVNEFPPHDAVVISLRQYPDRDPVISVTTVTDAQDVQAQFAPSSTLGIVDAFVALGQGGTLCDALREAADLLDGDQS